VIEAIKTAETNYIEHGWCEIDLPNTEHINELKTLVTAKLISLTGNNKVTLSSYHQFVSDLNHDKFQWKLANLLWKYDIGVTIGRSQYEFLRSFISPDLLVQAKPFLRIARPGRAEDCIGYHRDTSYGQSPYEVTMFIPLVDLPQSAALHVAPKTHMLKNEEIHLTSLANPKWKRRSQKHSLGFPYSPKIINGVKDINFYPVPLRLGQAMLFSPSLVHGQTCNNSSITRFSIDLRFLNAHAPIRINKAANNRGYKAVYESAVQKVAAAYLN